MMPETGTELAVLLEKQSLSDEELEKVINGITFIVDFCHKHGDKSMEFSFENMKWHRKNN